MPHSVTVTRVEPSALKPRLEELERKYGMNTAEFLNRWMGGELDSHDFVRWAGLCQMLIKEHIDASWNANAAGYRFLADR